MSAVATAAQLERSVPPMLRLLHSLGIAASKEQATMFIELIMLISADSMVNVLERSKAKVV